MKYSRQLVDFLSTCFPGVEKEIVELYLKEKDGLESIIETLLAMDQEVTDSVDCDSHYSNKEMDLEKTYVIQTTWASVPVLIPRSVSDIEAVGLQNSIPVADWETRFSKVHLCMSQDPAKDKEEDNRRDLLPFLLYVLEHHDGESNYTIEDHMTYVDLIQQMIAESEDLRCCARMWREKAYDLASKRILLLQKASKAYHEHGGGAAAYYSEESRKLLKDINEYHTKASQYQLLYLHPKGVYDKVDFHGLRVIDVTRLFWPLLEAWKNISISPMLTIITGSGTHSKGFVGKIRSALISMLQHQKRTFSWKALPGSIVISLEEMDNKFP